MSESSDQEEANAVKRRTTAQWDQEYEQGAHWEKEPDKHAIAFARLLQDGSRILDAGCGSGRDVIYLAKQSHKVTGIDLSPIGIEKARTSCRQPL